MKSIAVIGMLFLATLTYGATTQEPWQWCRDALTISTDDDTPLGATTKTWILRPTESKPIPRNGDIVQVAFIFPAADDTVTYSVYVYPDKSDAQLVSTGTATCGGMVSSFVITGTTKGKYAHTIAETYSWAIGTTLTDNSGSNRMATISFDAMGAKYLYVELSNKSGKRIGCIYRTIGTL